MMWGSGYQMGWWTWVVMGGGTLTFWVVVVLLVRSLLPANRDTERPDPLTLLKERLAHGDLSPEDYEQRRRLLVDGH